MRWAEFEPADPDLAQLGRERFEAAGVVLVGTLRRDGWPRISPVEPYIVDDDLYLGMMWRSAKALDLLRDPRCTVHSVVSSSDGSEGEFKLWGRAIDVQDASRRERFGRAVTERTGGRPGEPYHLFAIEIASAAFISRDSESQKVRVWRP